MTDVKAFAYELEEIVNQLEIVNSTFQAVNTAMYQGHYAAETYEAAMQGIELSMQRALGEAKALMERMFAQFNKNCEKDKN